MAVLDKRSRNDPRRDQTERAFLTATLELLDEGASFADLSVSRIAERAGRTRSAFYAHFEDRRVLLRRLIDEIGGDVLGVLDPFLHGDGPVDRAVLDASTRATLARYRERTTLIRAVTEAAGYDQEIAAYWAGVADTAIEAARRKLELEGLAPADAEATATALVWMCERTCHQQVVRDTGIDDDVVCTAMVNIWWNSILAARAAAGGAQPA